MLRLLTGPSGRSSMRSRCEKLQWQWRTRVSCILQRSNAQMLLSRAVHQESSCPAHAHRARASCLPDSTPYGRDGLAHSHSLSTARRALRVAEVGVASFINQFIHEKNKRKRQ